MAKGPSLLVYPAKDLDNEKALFQQLLGSEPYADAPYYVGFKSGDVEIGLDPRGSTNGPLAYWAVDDIKRTLQQLVGAGWQPDQDVRSVGGGRQIATVKDPNGNTVGLMQG
jgi:predicted enzyme related to lactoylglutathione lyase